MKRYWWIVFPDDKFGPRNLGVTAFSSEQAKFLLKKTLASMEWEHISNEVIETAEIIENVDVRILDEKHVLPNIGIGSRQGVWFPNCNS